MIMMATKLSFVPTEQKTILLSGTPLHRLQDVLIMMNPVVDPAQRFSERYGTAAFGRGWV